MGSRDAAPAGGEQHPAANSTTHIPHIHAPPDAHMQANDVAPSSQLTDAPPYWTSGPTRHSRSTSYHSLDQTRPAAIVLEDNTDDQHDHAQSCWAQSVSIDEYVVVSGPTGIGAYVVWHCTVTTLKGGDLCIRKRSSASRHSSRS